MSFIEVHIDPLQLKVHVALIRSCSVNAMFITDHLPELQTHWKHMKNIFLAWNLVKIFSPIYYILTWSNWYLQYWRKPWISNDKNSPDLQQLAYQLSLSDFHLFFRMPFQFFFFYHNSTAIHKPLISMIKKA